MNSVSLFQRLRGPFNFIQPQPESMRALFPEADSLLALPGQIFLEDTSATPVYGFPVSRSQGMVQLGEALRSYVESEERAQLSETPEGAGESRRIEMYQIGG